jgi:hypothetical protein
MPFDVGDAYQQTVPPVLSAAFPMILCVRRLGGFPLCAYVQHGNQLGTSLPVLAGLLVLAQQEEYS